jgi:beta-lactamase regulating signal transducer with metallopeptidase domain
VWAAGARADLFFPAALLGRLDATRRSTLLVHELAHVKRRDHWVRWLELVVIGLYWWYPLVWWARRRLRAAEEECCDAWVVRQLPGRSKAYATALLDTLDFLAGSRLVLPTAALGLCRRADLQRRLTLIMKGGTPSRQSLPGWAVVLLVALLGWQAPTLARQPGRPAPAIPAPDAPPAGVQTRGTTKESKAARIALAGDDHSSVLLPPPPVLMHAAEP